MLKLDPAVTANRVQDSYEAGNTDEGQENKLLRVEVEFEVRKTRTIGHILCKSLIFSHLY